MKTFLIFVMVFITSFSAVSYADLSEKNTDLFTREEIKRFIKDISGVIERSWKEWQDSVRIEDVDVEGSRGMLFEGDITGPLIEVRAEARKLDNKDRPAEYAECIRIVASAVEDGMRSWQRGYSHQNIPFPRGASCTFTLTPCTNVPVMIGSGASEAGRKMTEEALFSYMLYRTPRKDEKIYALFRASAGAIAECYMKWKRSCFIVDIVASGGIAPQPAPMGSGPGPVRGAKGKDGRLSGQYFNGVLMAENMKSVYRPEERLET